MLVFCADTLSFVRFNFQSSGSYRVYRDEGLNGVTLQPSNSHSSVHG